MSSKEWDRKQIQFNVKNAVIEVCVGRGRSPTGVTSGEIKKENIESGFEG